ncbi:MAG: response regulator [Deltaproteobacteria bacterium]|nr:response regulator [Deltaproteobacteria bacterium]
MVDDEPMVRETLKLFLENLGIVNVTTADSGENALNETERNRYDYVFIDLMMPGINGIQTLQKIHEYYQITSVIIMTGYPSMDVVIDAMHKGASDFLVKPFRLQDIKIILERIQRFHLLMEKNWLLHQELEEKKEVEKLNNQLEKKIRLQTIMYNIVDSLSRINRSTDLYPYLINKAIESCYAQKACFMIYDEGRSNLLTLAQKGFEGMDPGIKINLHFNTEGKRILDREFIDTHLGESAEKGITLEKIARNNGLISVPFDIRNEPFGVLFIAQKKGQNSFDEEDEFILRFLAEKAALNIENMALYDNLNQSLMATLMSLVSAIEAKDPYTQQHSSRVTELSLKIARKMGCNHDDLQRLKSTCPIHDIGKIGINDSILNKPGNLTEDEFQHIKSHPLIGVNIVAPLGLDPEELAIIRNHHERWDGRGYPDNLKEENIPILSRILAVADAFDAMSSDRAYRKALPFSKCLQELKYNRCTQFDPEVVEAALSVFIS